MQLHQFANAFFSQLQHAVHLLAGEGHPLGSALHFHEMTGTGHDHVHVGVAGRVFGVVQVQQRGAVFQAHRNGGHMVQDGRLGQLAGGDQPIDGILRGHKGAGDAGGAGANITLATLHRMAGPGRGCMGARAVRCPTCAASPPMLDLLPVLRVLGILLMVFALTMGLPLGVSWVQGDGVWRVYPVSMAVTMGVGLALWVGLRRHQRELLPRHGVMLVTLVWVLLPLCAVLPLMLALHQVGRPVSFTHAYFEAVSGLTTTGATVLSGLDSLPVSVNVWRTFLQWVGGMGILILAVAVLPLVEVVRSAATDDEPFRRAAAFVRKLDKLPLPVKDEPGFLVNAVLGPYMYEALRCLDEGIAPETIDAALLAFGMPMGPFQIYDIIGLNTPYNILSHGDEHAQSLAAWLKENYIDKGRLGIASGEGFYSYKPSAD